VARLREGNRTLPKSEMTDELLQLVAQLEQLAKPKPEMDAQTFESWQESYLQFLIEQEEEA